MDNIFSKNKLQVAIPILFGVIYFSAFKNGKQTCDRYFANYFLYLLTSLAVYFYSSNELDFGISDDGKKGILAIIILFGLIFSFHKVDNVWLKHIMWFSIIIILGIVAKKYHEKFNEKEIKSVLKKLIIVLLICVGIALTFPQILKPNFEIALLFGLIITLILRVLDQFVFKRDYSKTISYVVIFIFSVFVMYDTKRVMEYSKKCVNGKTGYLENVLDMFLNIINLFNNLLFINE
tara:strand:- start:582 stop:1286 length:705 start_codon:yes stop_codon:yes gene_type:complete